MQILLDTHILLWALNEPERLNPDTRTLLTNPANDIHFSAISILEIAFKANLGRIDFLHEPADVAADAKATGFIELPVISEVAGRVRHLPHHHRDPFDRLLIAQTLAGPYQLITSDAALTAYSPLVTLIEPLRP